LSRVKALDRRPEGGSRLRCQDVGSHLCTGTFGIGSLERGDDALVIFVAGRHGEGQCWGAPLVLMVRSISG
jgi:hypothetical protein